jgi:hypothetical protein
MSSIFRHLTDAEIEKMARFGYCISQECKRHECARVSDRFVKIQAGEAVALEAMRLMVFEDCADLYQVGLARDAQRTWTLRTWEKRIRQELQQPVGKCAWCGKELWINHKCN